MTTLESLQARFRTLTDKTAAVHTIMRTSPYAYSHPEAKLSLGQAALYMQGAISALAGKDIEGAESALYERVKALQQLCEECLDTAHAQATDEKAKQKALVDRASKTGARI